jgi:serine/threonine protein kinase
VKVLTGNLFGNRDALRRFEREAQASARLNHPNITTVYDYGLLSTEGAYLVMELIHGCTLRALIKSDGFVSPFRAAALFDQVLSGVAAAHNAGIVHRDLKPENIFIAKGEKEEDVMKILDFGLAKFAQQEFNGANYDGQSVTTPGTVMGTFGYMAPEQLTGGKVDERSDLFSVGVMVVETLTGRRPFSGKTHHEMLTNILQKPFRLSEQSSEARLLDLALQRCLAKDAKNRFASVAALQRDLIPAIRNCPPLGSHRLSESEAQTAILNS